MIRTGDAMGDDEIRLGIIGCGSFGLFALQQFVQVPGVRLVGMAGTHREAAIAAAHRFGVEHVQEVDALLARNDVDLVYIATPPFLHYEQGLQALQAGKHVICEKPLAMSAAQADEMVTAARERKLLLAANLLQRYNPLADAVAELVNQQLMGELLHGYFENYASDESLSPEHWFWDRAKSGGIFIEHGVHFFDLFARWLGAGDVVAALASRRTQYGVEDQVQCTVRYSQGVFVNFYHGFHQPSRLDRQELRLVFERGQLTLHEWIPTRYHLLAATNEQQARGLCELFPRGRLDASEVYGGKQRACRGRFRDYDVYQLFELSGGHEDRKLHRYGSLLQALFTDQISWIRNESHERRLTEQNGRDSVALAEQAAHLAAQSSPERETI
jgi:predicted dehydrogenase